MLFAVEEYSVLQHILVREKGHGKTGSCTHPNVYVPVLTIRCVSSNIVFQTLSEMHTIQMVYSADTSKLKVDMDIADKASNEVTFV